MATDEPTSDLDAEDRIRTGEQVRAARKALGWTKARAARFAGVSTITWTRVEEGKVVWDANLDKAMGAVGLGGSVQPVGDPVDHVSTGGEHQPNALDDEELL